METDILNTPWLLCIYSCCFELRQRLISLEKKKRRPVSFCCRVISVIAVKLLKAQKSKIIKLQLWRSVVWPLLPSGRRLILQCQMKASSCLLIQSAAAAPQRAHVLERLWKTVDTHPRGAGVSAVHQLPGSKVDKCAFFFSI